MAAPWLMRSPEQRMVAVLVARSELRAGSELHTHLLAKAMRPVEYVHPFQVASQDLEYLDGRILRHGIATDQPLLWSDLMEEAAVATSLSATIPNGYRAVTLPLHRLDAFGGLIEPGDTVDVWQTGSGAPQLLMASVPIAALDDRLPGESVERDPQTVTFAIPAADAQKLLALRSRNEISFLLRNPADVTDISIGRALAEIGVVKPARSEKPRQPAVAKPESRLEDQIQMLFGR